MKMAHVYMCIGIGSQGRGVRVRRVVTLTWMKRGRRRWSKEYDGKLRSGAVCWREVLHGGGFVIILVLGVMLQP
jgi:hypothetical protein